MAEDLPILQLKPINSLLNQNFYVPSYQRGYRWDWAQVKELLDDIWEFRELNQEGTKEAFYCLQPVVIRNNGTHWEVIDGQQRLTTVFLILKYLEDVLQMINKSKYSIDYETRSNTKRFLEGINQAESEDNIDFYHIWKAYEAIKEWFESKDGNAKLNFLTTLLNDDNTGRNVQVIWYELGENDSNPIEIFTRLNIGKIPLTNAELIKALFLGKVNSSGQKDEDWVYLKRLEIAGEWDNIENTLQDETFWCFIYNGAKKYDTKIEYIFDLVEGKSNSSDDYYTFNKFYEKLKTRSVDEVWIKVKKYFQTLNEWYNDHYFYHMIGYLVNTNFSTIYYLKNQYDQYKTKTEFKHFIENEIKEKIDISNEDLRDLYYPSREIKDILLLFNVKTIVSGNVENSRFPFDRFKNERWDIEHVHARKSDDNLQYNERYQWIENLIWYFTGDMVSNGLKENGNNFLSEEERKIVSDSQNVLINGLQEDEFINHYERVMEFFGEENEPEESDGIENLALLDQNSNRALSNAPFPVKRRFIIFKDMANKFIPIGTKNVFLKTYSKRMDNIMYWQESDAKDYLEEIEQKLKPFLK